MKKLLVLLLLAAISLPGLAQTIWKADKAHTQIKFDVTHMGISTVSGAFTDFEASLTTTKDDFSDAVFNFTAKAVSVNTGIEQRDKHLRSADFFDVEQFSTLSFKSTGLEKISEGRYKLSGDLTLHGVTKPIQLELWHRGTITNPKSKKQVAGFNVSGSLNRSDFAIGTKFPAEMLGEQVKLTADGEFSVE
ncbi:YceI family protein [Olivibacter domesticus]|uniref:Polyisoprenoid-binding protein YceI n=1 Tax=Olivibacter domesticus TaxID=407022 RepID=A0A1H7LZU1_OLID1|nr:YceI family protein [Olivibacter domesticus]SEL04493.1 Polyisoprenoid-binding protein YceI [Olivibacter domesticus]